MIYLDNSATTKPLDRVVDRTGYIMSNVFGNPSSLHKLGIEAEGYVSEARQIVADSLGVSKEEIYFNSGGTEGANFVISGVAKALKRRGNKIITSEVEHPAVLRAMESLEREGFNIVKIPVDSKGMINLERLKEEIDASTILISIMAVNNEVGTIMPIEEICRVKGDVYFHSDCVQAFGKLDLKGFKGEFLTASGHKIHGPKGIGFQYVKSNSKVAPLITGGGQEKGLRSGTENVAAISGLGIAAAHGEKNLLNNKGCISGLKEMLLAGIESEIKDIKVNSPEDGIHNILNISFLGVRGEVLLHTLEQDEIYVSTGSACSSNKKGQSHVLKAMGLSDKEIEGAVRFSLSEFNTKKDIEITVEKVKEAVTGFRRLGSFR
ncbi:MAG: cysteine desulfurase family protein [Peptostreptococcaceae bacterium]|nr:cysteine desulfurase family protein [Peptostreptococcaceae bacterium]MDY5738818.1 cysteine desulfurase family protein [Anaerovoracaceae bacterium]